MLKKVMDKNIKLYYVIVMLSVLKKNDVDFKVTRPSFLFFILGVGGGGGYHPTLSSLVSPPFLFS